VSGCVDDARAGRADRCDLGVAVLNDGGNSRVVCGGALEQLEAEGGGLLLEALVDEVAVAVVLLALRELGGSHEAKGHGASEEDTLHCEGVGRVK
jgi:hypothetical protein